MLAPSSRASAMISASLPWSSHCIPFDGHTYTAAVRRLPWWLVMTVIVVGAAVLDGRRLLAARRLEPPQLAGGWELPGGKVEAGESEEEALVRECREELGVDIRLLRRIGGDWPLGASAILRVWTAEV